MRGFKLLQLALPMASFLWISPVFSQTGSDSEALSKALSNKIISKGEIIGSSLARKPFSRGDEMMSWYHVRYKGTLYVCFVTLGTNSNREVSWSQLRCLEPI